MTNQAHSIRRVSDAFKARVSDAARRHASVRDERANRPSRWFGAPLLFAFSERVGGEISKGDYVELVGTVRRCLKSNGEVRQVAEHLEWTSDLDIVFVRVAPNGGETMVEVRLDAAWDAVATFVITAIVVLAVVTGAAVQSADGVGIGFVAAFVLGGYLVARSIWRGVAFLSVRRLQTLMRVIREKIGEIAGRRAAPVAG